MRKTKSEGLNGGPHLATGQVAKSLAAKQQTEAARDAKTVSRHDKSLANVARLHKRTACGGEK